MIGVCLGPVCVPQPIHEFHAVKRTADANARYDDIRFAGAYQSLVRGVGGQDGESEQSQVAGIHLAAVLVGFRQEYDGAACRQRVSAWGSGRH